MVVETGDILEPAPAVSRQKDVGFSG
jgi:hypothetical protein